MIVGSNHLNGTYLRFRSLPARLAGLPEAALEPLRDLLRLFPLAGLCEPDLDPLRDLREDADLWTLYTM